MDAFSFLLEFEANQTLSETPSFSLKNLHHGTSRDFYTLQIQTATLVLPFHPRTTYAKCRSRPRTSSKAHISTNCFFTNLFNLKSYFLHLTGQIIATQTDIVCELPTRLFPHNC